MIMTIQIYDIFVGTDILESPIHIESEDCTDYLDLIKKNGFEDDEGNSYKFSDAKVTIDGLVIYVELEKT